jgi:hypothetical protein
VTTLPRLHGPLCWNPTSMRAFVLAAACAAVVVSSALAAGRATSPDPKAMVVRVGDLPRGFVKQAARSRSVK